MAATKYSTPCPNCRQSNRDTKGDNLKWFYNDTGKLISKCVSCGHREIQQGGVQTVPTLNHKSLLIQDNSELLTTGRYESLDDRGITEETCRKFYVQVGELHGKSIHIYNYLDKEGSIVAQKIRFTQTKEFIWRGKNESLFGQHLTLDTDKLFITEGELDALTLFQLGKNVCSISTGAGHQTVSELKKHLDYFETFKQIIIVFDNDKVGQDTAKEVAKLFTPGKCYNCSLRAFKDPNEYLKAGKIEQLIEELSSPILVVPDNIRQPTLESLLIPEQKGLNICFSQLNQVIKGIKPGRIYTLGAGSGAGKSTFTRELLFGLLQEYTDLKVGAVYLEEPIKTTALSFIALENNVPLHELEEQPEKLNLGMQQTYDKYIKSGRIQFVDASFMKLEGKELVRSLDFLVRGLGCQIIVLDHLTMITYDMQGENSERKDIDILMKSLRELTYKTQCSIILVSHLKRSQFGKSWAEGREVNMSDLRGSSALEQLSDVIIAIERNMIDDIEKSKTKVKVLKNRITGKTGYVDTLFYEDKTGRLITLDKLFK